MARSSSTQPDTPVHVPATIVAAAKRMTVKIGEARDKRIAWRPPAEWQVEAWAYFDDIPEVKFATRYTGNAMAKLRVFPAQRPASAEDEPLPFDAEEGLTIPEQIRTRAQDELNRLKGPLGGLSEILREMNVNLEVAAECYLVGLAERELTRIPPGAIEPEQVLDESGAPVVEPESWDIKSISEMRQIDVGGKKVWAIFDTPEAAARGKDSDASRVLTDDDTVIRIWTKHPRFSMLPDTNMRALLFECQILQTLNQQMLAEANSRNSAGIFAVPSELSFGTLDQTEMSDGEGDQADDADPFSEELGIALSEPIGDPSSPYSIAPLIVRGPAEFLGPDSLRRIDLSRDSSETLDARITGRIVRIAHGLNLPPEVVLGHDSTTFSNAAQIDQDEFDDYLQPRAVLCVDALTEAYLIPQLIEAFPGQEELIREQVMVWFDERDLVSRPDLSEAAELAYDRNEISGEAYRRAKGFDESDAPDDAEILRRTALRKGIFTADLTWSLLAGLFPEAIPEYVPLEDAPPPLDPNRTAAGDAARMAVLVGLGMDEDTARAVLAELGAPVPDPPGGELLELPTVAASGKAPAADDAATPGRRLLDIDRELRTRLLVAADAAMTRALERAGNRLSSQLQRLGRRDTADMVKGVPATHRAAMLGRALVAAAGIDEDDLIADAFAELERQWYAWGAQAQDEALDVASQISSGLTTAERAALKLRQAADLDEGWAWLREALESFTAAGLYSPDPTAPLIGEFDPSLKVPTGMIRQAMARAGGASAFTVDGTDAWVAILPDGSPAGGIGTGDLVRSVLTEHGAGIEGYRWVYGMGFRRNTFEPHLALNGVEFVNFDDPVLANSTGFPARDYFLPGDHKGCLCDFELTIIPAPSVIGGLGEDTSE